MNKEELKRRIIFEPCKDKASLKRWIKIFLGLEMPEEIVDPTSTSSPMNIIWEIYEKALKNDDRDFNRILFYASRASIKTLGASILEVLALVHLQRDVVHLSAIEEQSFKSKQYVNDFLSKPILRDFIVDDSKRRITFIRFYNKKTANNISLKQWEKLPEQEKDNYERIRNSLEIIVCTVSSANGKHSTFNVTDEVDLMSGSQRAAYEEAKMIPDAKDGKRPITVLTSTRKYSTGIIQEEIDNAHNSGLHVRHWNILDVTKNCEPERHKPHLAKIPLYYSTENLRTVTQEDFEILHESERTKYTKKEAFQGCKDCKLFSVCRGELAKRPPSKSVLLKDIDDVINMFSAVSIDNAKSQLLCWSPSSEGKVYPNFDRDIHILSAAQIAKRITGTDYPEDFTKKQLIDLLKSNEIQFYCGIDHGFTHAFAVTVGAAIGDCLYIIDAYEFRKWEISQKINFCRDTLKTLYDPITYADTAAPDLNLALKKEGQLKIRAFDKGKVIDGIEIVRSKMMSATGEPKMFLLKDDPGCELLAKKLMVYSWEMDTAGRLTGKPNDDDDDLCDSIRYLVQNVFSAKKMKPIILTSQQEEEIAKNLSNQYTTDNWMEKVIEDAVIDGDDIGKVVKGKKLKGFF